MEGAAAPAVALAPVDAAAVVEQALASAAFARLVVEAETDKDYVVA